MEGVRRPPVIDYRIMKYNFFCGKIKPQGRFGWKKMENGL